jgi:hypothetical protein
VGAIAVDEDIKERLPSGLFERYAGAIAGLPSGQLTIEDLRCERFRLQADGRVEVFYTPFDYVNAAARVTLVGITPGWHQMQLAYTLARDLLHKGLTHEAILARVSSSAGFSGPMRTNLVQMLDDLGLPACLDIDTSAELFDLRAELRHSTSAIRYAAFASERNYTGSSPPLVGVPLFRRYVFDVLAPELAQMPGAVVIPLGRAVDSALGLLIDAGALDPRRCCLGFPHPSGANGWRVRQFAQIRGTLGDKVAAWLGDPTG